MNADELLKHYERVADAPDAVARLRRLVVDLAVRGRLLPQQPGDRPQADALAHARKELGERAKATGRLRFAESAPIGAEEIGDQLPKGWLAARVNDTGLYINGLAFKPSDWKASGLPIIRIQNLSDASREFNYAQGEFPDEVLVRAGDILVSWSATLDAYLWPRETGVLNQHIFRVIQATGLTESGYLLLLLKRAIRDLSDSVHAHGLVMTHVNRGPFLNHVLWIPPLAEQHRIVAKVDELMALCGRLEAARATRESARDRLAAASLARLNAPDPETFHEDARFALDALPALTTRPDQIKQLRQTILSLAMCGKLVAQDPTDEPASALLARKASLPTGYSRRRKILKETSIEAPAVLFPSIPSGWAYSDVQSLYDLNVIVDYADGNHGALYPRSSEFGDEGIAFVTAKDLIDGRVNWPSCARLNEARAKQLPKGWAQGGDVLLTHNATVGRVARVGPDATPFLLGTSVTYYRLNPEALCADFFYFMLKGPMWQGQLEAIMAQTTRNQVSIQKQAFFRIALPPLAEQHRIVAKVDELMALCDRLEASLIRTDTHRRRLLEALLHEALEPTEALEEAA
jgi:type I restriction enzyme S subunit